MGNINNYMSHKKDLYSIGEAYGSVLNGLKSQLVKEDKTVTPGEVGDAPLTSGGPEERGGFKPAAIDITTMTDKEKDENLYNIKGNTYGDGNNPGMGNQQPEPTGPEFNQVPYIGNVGGPEEDEETHDKTGHLSDKALLKKVRGRKGAAGKALLDKAQKEIDDNGSLSAHTRDSLARDAYEEDEEILAEHEKNARRSLNNFMAKQSVFDKLYNKVMISENFPPYEGAEEVEEIDDLEALGIETEEPEDITVTIPSDLAQTLCDILTAALEDQEVEVETEVDVDETIDFEEDAEDNYGKGKHEFRRRKKKYGGKEHESKAGEGPKDSKGHRHYKDYEEDEEAQMKDGGGYGVDAGSTLKKEINYGKKNKVGRLHAAGGPVMKDGGGYGVDAGSTLGKEVDHALKNNKVGNMKLGNIPGA